MNKLCFFIIVVLLIPRIVPVQSAPVPNERATPIRLEYSSSECKIGDKIKLTTVAPQDFTHKINAICYSVNYDAVWDLSKQKFIDPPNVSEINGGGLNFTGLVIKDEYIPLTQNIKKELTYSDTFSPKVAAIYRIQVTWITT